MNHDSGRDEANHDELPHEGKVFQKHPSALTDSATDSTVRAIIILIIHYRYTLLATCSLSFLLRPLSLVVLASFSSKRV